MASMIIDPLERIERYLAVVQSHPGAFENQKDGGIRILLTVAEILSAEKEIKARYKASGKPANWAECGLYYEDPWMYLVRDVVVFPNGGTGTYHHILFKGGLDGVVIFPVFKGRVVLLRHYRNGARGWSWEIPRGGPQSMDPQYNAITEIREELGGEVAHIEKLGSLKNNNGMISETMQIFYAELSDVGECNIGEGITEVRFVSRADLEAMIGSGEIDDCHTVHAYTLARLQGRFST